MLCLLNGGGSAGAINPAPKFCSTKGNRNRKRQYITPLLAHSSQIFRPSAAYETYTDALLSFTNSTLLVVLTSSENRLSAAKIAAVSESRIRRTVGGNFRPPPLDFATSVNPISTRVQIMTTTFRLPSNLWPSYGPHPESRIRRTNTVMIGKA